jgi:hypothetical protein
MNTYSEGQLNKFRRLLKVASRFLLAGDLMDRMEEVSAQNVDMAQHGMDVKRKFRRKKVRLFLLLLWKCRIHARSWAR